MPSTSFSFKEEEKARIEPLLIGNETISQFAYRATIEKVNRMETRDERSRVNLMQRDKNAFRRAFVELMKEYGFMADTIDGEIEEV